MLSALVAGDAFGSRLAAAEDAFNARFDRVFRIDPSTVPEGAERRSAHQMPCASNLFLNRAVKPGPRRALTGDQCGYSSMPSNTHTVSGHAHAQLQDRCSHERGGRPAPQTQSRRPSAC